MTKFTLPDYLVDYFPDIKYNLGKWRQKLRDEFLVYRDLICRGCGMPMKAYHQHEGIYSRNDVKGWKPKAQRILIHTPFNNILLCPNCNLGLSGKNPPTRERVFYEHLEMYGDIVIEWCNWLPFKDNPMKGFLE